LPLSPSPRMYILMHTPDDDALCKSPRDLLARTDALHPPPARPHSEKHPSVENVPQALCHRGIRGIRLLRPLCYTIISSTTSHRSQKCRLIGRSYKLRVSFTEFCGHLHSYLNAQNLGSHRLNKGRLCIVLGAMRWWIAAERPRQFPHLVGRWHWVVFIQRG